MARRRLEGLRAIITGASSGVGRALAILLAAEGMRLLLTARREDRLEALASEINQSGGTAIFLPGDIASDPLRRRLVERAESEFGGLDVLVNNAGIGAYGPFEEASADRLRMLMEVNFFSAVELTRLCLPLLQEGRSPIICNVSSILAHRAVPGKSEYCASKFALHGFSDALRAELSTKNIDVLLVSPSTISSEFSQAVVERRGKQPAVGKLARTPESVAKAIVRGLRSGRHEVIPSNSGRALVWLDRLSPWLADIVLARFG